jgi:hypothetical protein
MMVLGVQGPVRLITGAEAAPAFPVWVLPAVFGGVAVLALATWAWVAYRARAAGDVNEHAFRCLARSMRLGRAAKQMIRRLAFHHGSASPLGLLMSEHALRTAVEAFQKTDPGKRDQRVLETVRRTLTV